MARGRTVLTKRGEDHQGPKKEKESANVTGKIQTGKLGKGNEVRKLPIQPLIKAWLPVRNGNIELRFSQ